MDDVAARLRARMEARAALDAEIQQLTAELRASGGSVSEAFAAPGPISCDSESLSRDVARLKQRVDRLEAAALAGKHGAPSGDTPDCVTQLNVGGTVFATLRSTLTAYPTSMLAALVSGRHHVARDAQGLLFVDRDPRFFSIVLMFLRGEQPLPLHDDEARRRFAADCDYYGLPRPDSPFVVSAVRLLRTLHAHTNLWAMDARGDLIVAGNKLFRINGSLQGELVGHSGPILCVKIARTLDVIATGSEDATVRLWSVKTLQCEKVLTGHTMSVCALDVADGVVCSASADWAIRVWKLDTGEFLRVLHATEPVFCVRIDGDLIICGGEKAIHVWSRSKYRLQKTFSAHTKPTTNIATLGPYAITSSNDRSVKVWQKLSWNCVRMHEYECEATAMDVAGDFLFCGDSSGIVTIRSVTSGALLRTVDTKKSSILALCVLEESHLFVCCSVAGEVLVYECG